MVFSTLLEELIDALRCLPGVGPKSAQRMAFHLLERHRPKALKLADTLTRAMHNIRHCQRCNNYCETDECRLCAHPKRQPGLLCVVESPADVLAIEQAASYRGLYFVLMGHLSPLDGIGPDDIAIPQLTQRLQDPSLSEVILATNPTVEGEATAHFIADLARTHGLQVSRIAQGVPMGGELEFVDSSTLSRAISERDHLV